MRTSKWIVAAVVCAAVAGACGGGGDSTSPQDELVLAVFAGNGQTAIVGQAVAVPPSVRVTNHLGLPLEGVTIVFTATAGNGVVDGERQQTNSSGIARVRGWTLGTAAKVDSLVASAETSTGQPITDAAPVKFTAMAVAGGAIQRAK